MEITKFGFLIGILFLIFLYYMVPSRARWGVLLGASLLFVASFDPRGLIAIGFTTLSVFLAAKQIEKLNMAQQQGNSTAGKKRAILAAVLAVNVLLLVALKYVFPYCRQRGFLTGFRLLIPLGISYYTLQILSYLIDVYWKRIPAEKNFGRLLLFVCYFPQLIQGPIHKYGALSQQLYEKEHRFDAATVKHGAELALWGYFQVLVVGTRAMREVQNLFWEGNTPYGLTALLGLAIFGAGLYCNFSGGIDIVRGVSQCFGIELAENFRQPYFALSLSDFWRRWHMSLGAWMKEYAFYPLTMSRPMSRLKKKCKQHMSRRMANKVAIAVSNVLVFLLVGLWHGLGSNFALWGLYNGCILAFSELMEDTFAKAKKFCRIREQSPVWKGFCMVRTFLIVCIGRTTDCAPTAGGAAAIFLNMLNLGATNLEIISFHKGGLVIFLAGLAVMLTVSILHEKGRSVREDLDGKPFVLQMLCWLAVIFAICFFGKADLSGGFFYANF